MPSLSFILGFHILKIIEQFRTLYGFPFGYFLLNKILPLKPTTSLIAYAKFFILISFDVPIFKTYTLFFINIEPYSFLLKLSTLIIALAKSSTNINSLIDEPSPQTSTFFFFKFAS